MMRTGFVQSQKPQISLEKRKGTQPETSTSAAVLRLYRALWKQRIQNRPISTAANGERGGKKTLDEAFIRGARAKATPQAGSLPVVSRARVVTPCFPSRYNSIRCTWLGCQRVGTPRRKEISASLKIATSWNVTPRHNTAKV